MTADRSETEIKLLAEDALDESTVLTALTALRSVSCGAPTRGRQHDVYLDDAALHLAKQGIGLRLRTTGRRSTLTCKREASEADAEGAFTRRELERSWHRDAPPRRADELGGRLRACIEPFVYRGDLAPIARLETDRTEVDVRDDRAHGVVCIDRVRTGGAAGTFTELEIELVDGDAERLRQWAAALRARLPVAPSAIDKLHRALSAGAVVPAADAPDASDGQHGGRASELCHRYLVRHFAKLQQHESAVRLDATVDAVHGLRVACRRLRSALDAFAPWLLDEFREPARRALQRTARAFGRVRDLDVLRGRLERSHDDLPDALRHGGEDVLARLEERRHRMQRKARGLLRRRRRLEALQHLQERLEAPFAAAMPSRARADAVGGQLVGTAVHEVERADSVHALRIALKRLRYTAELLVDTDGEATIAAVAAMQDRIGALLDAENAQRHLFALAHAERLGTDAALAAGIWVGQQVRAHDRARREFDAAWQAFDLPAIESALRSLSSRP